MKILPSILVVALLSASTLNAQTAPASSTPDTKAEEIIQLSPFEITGNQDKGYLAGNSVSATRFSTPVADLPFAISTFTPQLIADTASVDLYDIVRYAAGVTNGSVGFNFGSDVFTVRGFAQPAEHDGFYESSQGNIYVDMVNVDRVEVVKGPASLLYGQIAPGGTVNYITKHAEPKAFTSMSLTGGSYDYARATIDFNQPLIDKILLFRFNAAWQEGFEWKTPSPSKTTVIDPTVTWNITPKLTLKTNYQWFQRKETPTANYYTPMDVSTPASVVNSINGAAGNPAGVAALVGNTGPDAAAGFGSDASDPGFNLFYPGFPKRFNPSGIHDWRDTTIRTLTAELDLQMGSHWNGRANFDYNSNECDQFQTGVADALNVAPPNSLVFTNGVWSVAPSWTALSSAQQIAAELAFANQLTANPNAIYQLQNGTPAPLLNGRRPRLQKAGGDSKTVQTEAVGNYDFSWGKLKPLVGLYYDVAYVNQYLIQNTGASAASPNFRVWDVDPASPTFYINQDTPADPSTLTSVNTNNSAFTSDQAVYGILNGSFFDDRLYAVVGARYNRSQSQTVNYVVAAGTNPVGRGYKTHYTTPQGGFGYKITKSTMLYASYSQSYSLPSQPNLRTPQILNGSVVSIPTTQAAPVTGEGYDVGLKTDFLNGRISSTLSLYQITEVNVVQSVNQVVNGANVATDVQGTKLRGRGVEYELTWSPLDNWQVFASATEEDIRNVAEPLGYQYYLGAHPQQTAKTMGNLWTRYTFKNAPIKGIWIGGGFNYVGKSAADNRNEALFQPAYTLWNSALGYDWTWGTSKMTANVNWQNMRNVVYQPVEHISGLPERVTLSITARFQ